MESLILAINPGSTSTKIGLYKNDEELWNENIEHSVEELEKHSNIIQQLAWRESCVNEIMISHGNSYAELSAVVGRGGIMPPIKAGGYLVNNDMLEFFLSVEEGFHASNLGALIANKIAAPLGIPAYIYDGVSSDEMKDIARITGMKEVYRYSICHVLNSKAMCRKSAESKGKRYDEMNFVVAHLGGGVTVSAHEKGRIIDSNADDDGCFSPERSGSVPLREVIDLCYSGQFTHKEMLKKQRGAGGLKALLGTPDCREIEKRIHNGDKNAELIYEAFAYQVSKGIGLMAVPLVGNIDAVILTGGIAHSKMLTSLIKKWISFLGNIEVHPGENEIESLALGALRILKGEEDVNEYVTPINLDDNLR